MTRQEEKQQLRAIVRRLEAALAPEYKAKSARSIAHRLLAMPEYQEAQTVFCFVGTDREIDTRPILEDILAAAAKENTREKRRQDNLLMYSVRVVAGICAALVMIFSGAFRHITKINDIDMSKINDKSRSISQSIDESFNEFKQKISDLGGNNNEQKE